MVVKICLHNHIYIYIYIEAEKLYIFILILLLIGFKEGRKEMFYLMTHSTHFIYGYMASDIW